MTTSPSTQENLDTKTAKKATIAVARGDGIGPEIMDATLHILAESGAQLDVQEVEVGEQVYLRGQKFGIEQEAWEVIKGTEAFLKAPITTPQGGGFKSINVAVRTALGLYANVRPCRSFHPFVDTKHQDMDVVVVRENVEDLYIGLEYRQTQEAVTALKLITRTGCEKIIRYAFNYARANARKKVTCFTKDNILKLSDGLFHKVFQEIGKEYPDIEQEHWIIDIGAAKLADTPELFDVVVMPNLYGDILSDVSAQIAGSVGLAGSANVGENGAMFEAIHGSAPRRAGQNLANPSGLLMGAVQMLVHLGQTQAAENVHNGWLRTLEEGYHTYDIYKEGVSREKVGTREFAQAVARNLGKLPETLKPVSYEGAPSAAHSAAGKPAVSTASSSAKKLVGVDVFIQSDSGVSELQQRMMRMDNDSLELTLISNRGAKVWPAQAPNIALVDHWRVRFMAVGREISQEDVAKLMQKLASAGVDILQTQSLFVFGDEIGFSLSQGEHYSVK